MNFVEREFRECEGEQGFLLLGLVVAIFIILLVLAVAAPTVAHELRREQEVETVHRGNQYVRAIQLYYRKFGHYPGSMEQLEKTNNIRFLRKQYVDPETGKVDWRLIKVGEAKTTVKGFFGKPLTGLAPGLGSAAGMASGGGIGAGAAGTSGAGGSAFGSSGPASAFGGTSSSPTSGLGSSGPGSSGLDSSSGSSATTPAGSTSGSDSSGFGSNSGMGSQSATTFTGGGAPFEGVGLAKPGDSIITLNEQTTYPTWEFIYDPRIEQLKAAAAMQGGGANGTGMGGSSSSGSSSGFGNSSGSAFGNSSGSAFGNSSGSAFGNSSGSSSGFGSSSPAGSSPSSSSSPTSSGSGSSFP